MVSPPLRFQRLLWRPLVVGLAACVFTRLVGAVDPPAQSPKRGLVYVASDTSVDDDRPFTAPDSGLTWYYNYAFTPTDFQDGSNLSYVPMLFSDYAGADQFAQHVGALTPQPSYALAFNEPDMCSDGGSCLDTDRAASLWVSQMQPLQASGILVGSPAVSGQQSGLAWLQAFFSACYAYNSTHGCVPDFMAVHYYGDVQGLAAWIGQVSATYLNFTLSNVTSKSSPQDVGARGGVWVTEFAVPDADLATTQQGFHDTVSFLDSLYYVSRYAWFGAFRSDTSNVGPNAALLDANGALTDIGSYYVGGPATGNVPTGGSSSGGGDTGGVGKMDGAVRGAVMGMVLLSAFVYYLL